MPDNLIYAPDGRTWYKTLLAEAEKRGELESEVARLREALELIRNENAGECEHYTTGIGSCYRNGLREDAEYLADRCCTPCVANAALNAEAFEYPRSMGLREALKRAADDMRDAVARIERELEQ